MAISWRQTLHVLQLARLELVLSAVSNIWLVVWLSRAIEPASRQNPELLDDPLSIVLGLTLAVGAGMAAYGITLNDLIDLRHDKTFSPHRPLASGRVPQPIVVSIVLASLLAGLFAATFLGRAAMLLCLFNALAILFYNTTWKYLPAAGIIAMALIRVGNMLVANFEFGLIWPLLLTLAHVITCGTIVHMLAAKRPRLNPGEWWQLAVGTGFWAGVLVVMMIRRDTLLEHMTLMMWLLPGLSVLAFAALAVALLRRRTNRTTALQFERLSILWLIVYDIAWLAAAGSWKPAVLHTGLLITAVLCAGVLRTLVQLTHRGPRYHVTRPV